MTNRNLQVTLDGIVFGLQTYGGISNYWGRLIQHLDGLPQVQCHNVLPKRIRYAEYNNDWTHKSSVVRENLPNVLSRYADIKDLNSNHVFHSSYYRVPENKSVRYVVTVYDFIHERYRHGPARWVHSFQKLRSIRLADAVICISNATRDDVLRYAGDVDPGKVRVVYLGVDQDTFYQDRNGHAASLENMVLYVGQRARYKRFDLAVDALAHCPELTLGIVGPVLSQEEVAFLNSRLHSRWHSFGPVSSSRLRELYSNAFAFIFPSDYEGFGLPILEAMACGCPVVAAHTSSLPEVGGQAALYAHEQQPESFAAALTTLYDSADDRRSAIDAGMQRAREFSWERTFTETLAIYQGGDFVSRHV